MIIDCERERESQIRWDLLQILLLCESLRGETAADFGAACGSKGHLGKPQNILKKHMATLGIIWTGWYWLDVCYLVNFENKMSVRSQHHMADPSVE